MYIKPTQTESWFGENNLRFYLTHSLYATHAVLLSKSDKTLVKNDISL